MTATTTALNRGKLTTHILDTAEGCPAAGVTVKLYGIDGDDALGNSAQRRCLSTQVTNIDGRTDQPLLVAEAMAMGTYELQFWIGDYFASSRNSLPNPAFLDLIPIRFAIADPTAHYHVPLLVSPWSYSTYRGS